MRCGLIVFIVFYLMACSSLAFAQRQSVTDSLMSALDKEKADTTKLSILTKLIVEYTKTGKVDQAKRTLHILIPLANKSGDKLYLGSAYNTGAYVYASEANADSIQYYAGKALSVLRNADGMRAIKLKVMANNNLAVSYSTSGNMKKAIEVLIDNLSLIKAAGNNDLYQATINNISASFTMTGDNANAYKYMLQDIDLVERPGISLTAKVFAYTNAALVCSNLKKFDDQKKYLDKAQKALDLLGDSPLWGRYYAFEATYYANIHQYTEAISSAQKALDLSRDYPERSNVYMAYEAIRTVQAAMKHYDKARAAARQLFNMSKEDSYTEMMTSSAAYIADFSAELGDFKTAFLSMKEYERIKDSVQSQQNTQKINELEAHLRTSQKEDKIARLELEKKKASLQIKNQRLTNALLGGACLLMLILLGLFYVFYRSKKRTAAQREKLKITEMMLSAQEGERERMARDLHDGLVGSLSGIKMNLAMLADKQVDGDLKAAVSRSAGQLEDSIRELRHIAHNMMPEMLLRLGLEAALKDLCHLLETAGILVQSEFINLDQTVALDKQVVIYRIVQELFSNIVRHARASTVFFQCARQSNMFLITVDDDGIGMGNAYKTAGIGLKSAESRVHYLKGTMDISPMKDGMGTSINIQLYVAS